MNSIRTLLLLALLLPGSFALADDGLGVIEFPNSGAADAQPAFITGVKALHSFQFDEAQQAFQQAQAADPAFALAYWGEAMSVNKPLWRIQDTAAARAILEKLAPHLAGRLEKAASDKERAWLSAVEQLFYGADDKLQRDHAYSSAMRLMHERWPDDDEIAVFYALSILGTIRPGDQGFRRQARAAAISLQVFDRNPSHPGAAHFVIHAFDDPDHAILALPAARVYAGIAPEAAHALHMPSHIFVQLGMWAEVVSSNIDAYRAAVRLNERMNLPEGREDFHTLSWLAYGHLMLGNNKAAADDLQRAAAAMERNPGNSRIEEGYLTMRARHLLETGATPSLQLPAADSTAGRHANWVAAVGMIAARNGELATARDAITRLTLLGTAAAAASDAHQASRIAVLRDQVSARLYENQGDFDRAIDAAHRAAQAEMTLGAPSGPPDPIKPAWELYGEVLLEAGQNQRAIVAFEQALDWIPQRTPALLGLARAAAFAGDADLSLANYRSIAGTPGVHADSPALREASSQLH